jgi:hypothetical protein
MGQLSVRLREAEGPQEVEMLAGKDPQDGTSISVF